MQVLKAVADAERSTRPGTVPTPSPPRPRSLPHSGGRGVESGLGSLSPAARREGVARGGGETAKESPRSASRFRTVAAAAADEAKVDVFFCSGDVRFVSPGWGSRWFSKRVFSRDGPFVCSGWGFHCFGRRLCV